MDKRKIEHKQHAEQRHDVRTRKNIKKQHSEY